jgi:hypothetical protein
VLASAASGALFFLFKPTAAKPGDRVTVRLGGTPPGFTLERRVKPLKRPMRIYLVPSEVADNVRTRSDGRLSFVGALVPDKNGHGVLRFSVPPLDSGTYVPATWCPGCAGYSSGRTFFVQPDQDIVPRYERLTSLRVEMPDAALECPVTRPNQVLPPSGGRDFPLLRYANGFLSVRVSSDGGLLTSKESDGTFFQKLGWQPQRGLTGTLTVRGERLDAPSAPMKVLGVVWGHDSYGRGGWASAVKFPSEGCWRISGRVRDITLSYVVRVIGV